MSPKRARRLAMWIILALAVATLLPPFINANRFRNRLADTIRLSIGRPVTMGDVHFILLPRPGFVIQDLSVTDDPAFSAEPVLRAASVTAALRLTSLWRGRMEIARLSFDSPSLNLVRSADGRWNVESVLRQASQVPAAPTATPRPESRPRFPYIEASNGRINFREGEEKRPHALMDADFALWLETEDQWNMRLEARPTRTDAYLSDTGTLRITGQLRRAQTLAATAMQVDIGLEKAQLGQWTSLLTGSDRGWRGNTSLQLRLEGTVSEFTFVSKTEIGDFHRYDVANPDSLDARIECHGNVSVGPSPASPKGALECAFPLAQGTATLGGNVAFHSLYRDPDYDLTALFRNVPMASLANLYRRVKRNVPEDLTAQGTFNGEYHFVRDSTAKPDLGFVTSGRGRVTGLQLDSESRGASLVFGSFDVEFLSPKKPSAPSHELTIGSAGVRLGGTVPVLVAARLTPTAVTVDAGGDAALDQLLAAASLFGLADPRYHATGLATFSLGVNGSFADFAAPVITGTAQLRQVTTQVDGVAAPLVVQSATLQLTPDSVTVQKLAALLEGTNTLVEGNVTIPRHCASAECASSFDLKAAEVNLDDLNRVLNPRYRSTDWLAFPRIFSGQAVKTSRLMTLEANGAISIGRLTIKNLVATRATGRLSFNNGQISLLDFQAYLLSGKHRGKWSADLTGSEPVFTGQGTVEALPLAQVNVLLHTPQGTGTLRLTYDLTMRGADTPSLRHSASGQGTFKWTNGTWHTSGQVQAVQFSDWTGTLNVRDEVVDLTDSLMQTRSGPYQVSGRAGFDRELSLRLSGLHDQMLVSGTLQGAVVALSTPETLPVDSASNLKNATPAKAKH